MPRVVALDLGAHAVKVSVYHQSGRRSALEGHFQHPVAQDGTAPPDLEARLEALDALLAEHPAWANPSNEVALAWPAEYASVRRVDLPFGDRAQVEKTLPYTVEGEVPFDLDDMVLAWRPLPVEEGTRAFVLLAREDRLERWLSELARRGLDPRHVYLDGEVLGRWAPADATVAMVDVGHEQTSVAVCDHGRVVATRSVDVGGRAFTRAIQAALDVSWEEAERLKEGAEGQDGEIAQLPEPARKAADAAMALLLAELRSTLIAVEDDLELDVQRVVLTGGGARLKPLASYLAEDLGLPVSRLMDEAGAGVPPGHAISYGLALLAVRGAPKDRVLDLRVGELAYRGGVNVLRAVMVYGTAAMAFFLFATMVMFVVQYRSLAAEQGRVETRIRKVVTDSFPDVKPATLSDSTKAMSIMTQKTQDVTARADVLGETSAVPPTIDALRALTQAFPPPDQVRVEVSDLTITPAAISFSAETDSYASAAAVEESLQKSKRFSKAAKSGDRKIRDKVTFDMSIPLGEGQDGGTDSGDDNANGDQNAAAPGDDGGAG